ncbi:amidohydrolase family protein [Sphingomonas histidinilytica]|uniref:N-acyl-D-aspartate/D-glutamate deacylase n=1 Tax=Rhizorhabdus histidinilytica TaxID=439228 RepID=A0A1T5EJR6_9SPHN|nr:amidohydrolase family protein [Rhizorhabdus histidinilytica]MBO9380601.1 amidohydrolase family protein [Rhizorhabdus histidinilytica]QEH76780.1 amidohydrolase family protein [Sphingomonas sp. C8-2]SKB83920.1 N-acyl-D-aspartate/D-glutamate deacylase [Rhizorhabdus histidinilytica]
MLDIKIIGGDIIDGTGSERYRGDVAIKDGRVVALGKVDEPARQTIDASGKVVAPGFVDVHTHYDAQVFWDRLLSVSPWHGVTTVVMGNCGFGIAPTRPADREIIVQSLERVEGMDPDCLRQGIGEWPFESFPEYLDALEKRGLGINAGVLVGHLATRFYVMGEEAIQRHATDDEVVRMQDIIRSAMRAGAVGFSTSYGGAHFGYKGLPVASRFAAYEETRALADVLADFPGAIFAPNIGEGITLVDLEEIGSRTNATISWAPLITSEVLFQSDHEEQLAQTAHLASRGLSIAAQFSPKPMVFAYQFSAPMLFTGMKAFSEVRVADDARKLEIYADPAFRELFRAEIDGGTENFVRAIAKTEIGDGGNDPALENRTLGEVAEERGVHPIDVALDLAIASNLEIRFRMPLGNHLEDRVEPLLHSPHTLISLGDGGAHASQLCDACIPTFVLRRWVREKRVLSLEEAVRLLTSRPADLYNLADRGRLMVDRPADVVVFDPETVGDGPLRRIFDLPGGGERLVSDGLGVAAVIVNGTLIRQNGEDVVDPEGRLPGQLLRSKFEPAPALQTSSSLH